ncbi:unnamed protein product, partial [marine sediment metagenome]
CVTMKKNIFGRQIKMYPESSDPQGDKDVGFGIKLGVAVALFVILVLI